MSKNINHITKFLALLLILYGAIKTLMGVQGIWAIILHIFYSSSITLTAILYAVGMFFLFILIPAVAVVGGVGLYQKKKWGWVLSIIVSLTIFTLHCSGFVNFLIASYFYRDILIPPIPESSDVEYISMIPNYVITVVSLTYSLVLNCKPVKNEFIKSN